MKWRLIEQEAYDAAANMAIDQAICESVALEKELPTIRFYKWLPSSVSIGAYQNHNDIDIAACKKFGIGCVRRMTGGRAVFHDRKDFTYSVAAPLRAFDYNIKNAYAVICSWIIGALSDIGIEAELKNTNDIVAGGKKISGNASKMMSHGIYLQHGTLIYSIDFEVMPKVMKIDPEIMREKATSVTENASISNDEVYSRLKNSFARSKKITATGLSMKEVERAQSLAMSKYRILALPKEHFSKSAGACYAVHGN